MKSNDINSDYLNNLSKQLSCPQGEMGIEIGKSMALNNASMTFNAYSKIDFNKHKNILEIGFGNGSHFSQILSDNNIHITAIELSSTMLEEALKINKTLVDSKKLLLELTDDKKINLKKSSIDSIISVNTIYFWDNLNEYLQEIHRVLTPNGQLVLCFADKEFMKTLPFTNENFILYSIDEIIESLKSMGYTNCLTESKSEIVKSKANNLVNRHYWIITAVKV